MLHPADVTHDAVAEWFFKQVFGALPLPGGAPGWMLLQSWQCERPMLSGTLGSVNCQLRHGVLLNVRGLSYWVNVFCGAYSLATIVDRGIRRRCSISPSALFNCRPRGISATHAAFCLLHAQVTNKDGSVSSAMALLTVKRATRLQRANGAVAQQPAGMQPGPEVRQAALPPLCGQVSLRLHFGRKSSIMMHWIEHAAAAFFHAQHAHLARRLPI